MVNYWTFLEAVNKLMKDNYPEVKAWGLLMEERDGEVWGAAGFDIDRVAHKYAVTRQEERQDVVKAKEHQA